jgi:hypothetical protein
MVCFELRNIVKPGVKRYCFLCKSKYLKEIVILVHVIQIHWNRKTVRCENEQRMALLSALNFSFSFDRLDNFKYHYSTSERGKAWNKKRLQVSANTFPRSA